MNDAKKVAYLSFLYPKKTLEDILKILVMPAVSKDCAIWEGISQGWIEIDKEKKTITAMANVMPNKDDSISAIIERIIYGLRHQNENEEDVDEVMFLEWFAGFLPHDVLVAINILIDEEAISNYKIIDGENVYTFYTLPENNGKGWGKKRFKDETHLKLEEKNELDLP